MREESRNEARRWLAAAREDLALARHAAAGGFHSGACFHSQQAAEKAVKAVHYMRGARAVLGHSVRKLIEALDGAELEEMRDAARELDLLYIPSRYPNGLDAGTPGEAFSESQSSRAISHSESIIDRIASIFEQ